MDDGTGRATGLGDVALNYRFQAVGSGETRVVLLAAAQPAAAHRHAPSAGAGPAAAALQLNLPLSLVLSDRFVTHLNAGVTFTPGAGNAAGEKARLPPWAWARA